MAQSKKYYFPFSEFPSLGLKVEKGAATLPATTNQTLFTISGGRILLPLILGEVTTVIQTQITATKLVYDPVDAGANQDLSATLDISADAVGTIYHISGVLADPMRDNLNFGRGGLLAAPLLLKPGAILLNTAATSTGATKWTMWYVPLDDNALVTAG